MRGWCAAVGADAVVAAFGGAVAGVEEDGDCGGHGAGYRESGAAWDKANRETVAILGGHEIQTLRGATRFWHSPFHRQR